MGQSLDDLCGLREGYLKVLRKRLDNGDFNSLTIRTLFEQIHNCDKQIPNNYFCGKTAVKYWKENVRGNK